MYCAGLVSVDLILDTFLPNLNLPLNSLVYAINDLVSLGSSCYLGFCFLRMCALSFYLFFFPHLLNPFFFALKDPCASSKEGCIPQTLFQM